MKRSRLAIWSLAVAVSGPGLVFGLRLLVDAFFPRSVPIEGITILMQAILSGIVPPLSVLLGILALRRIKRGEPVFCQAHGTWD